MRYHYFVSFIYSKEKATVYGHCVIHLDKKMNTSKEIEDVTKYIAKYNNFEHDPTIISFIKIKGLKGK